MGETSGCVASGTNSHAEGYQTTASGNYSHSSGYKTSASGNYSHAEGNYTTAYWNYTHAEGVSTYATNNAAHTEGGYTTANGTYSHSEGYQTKALENSSHAEGMYVVAKGTASHAEGNSTTASGGGSHAEGGSTIASDAYSHAEGGSTRAFGSMSHAEGANVTASGTASHAEGYYTCASGDYQHIEGKYNVADSTMAHIIGGGTNASNRKNIFTVDWDGNVTAGTSTGIENSNKLVTGADIYSAGLMLNYSTTEQDTGRTWIDGKKIYQITIDFGALPNNNVREVTCHALGKSTVDLIIDVEAFGYSPSSVESNFLYMPLCYSSGGTDDNVLRKYPVNYFIKDVDGYKVIKVTTYYDRSGTNAYFTIRYTKNGDTN